MLDIVVLSKFYLKKFKGNKLALILIIAVVFASFSQSSVGIGTVTPNPSAILDVYSTNKGFLPPRMSKTQMNTISSPAEGLMIYCTSCTPNGVYIYNNRKFRLLQFFENPVNYLIIDDVSVIRGTTSFVISPTLTPTEATVGYSLTEDNPTGVYISGTTVTIPADMDYGEYSITVKATGEGDYSRETGATFKLNITQIALTGFSIADVSVPIGTTSFEIPSPTPTEATVDYELITKPTGVTIDGTIINISADMGIGEYNITVKARGNRNYTGEIEATFKLTIVFKNDDFVINFRDINFKNAVKSYCGITTNDVTYGDVKDRTHLNVDGKGITNMEEIRYFTSLKILHCSNNQLTSLDVRQNTGLNTLRCSDNQLTGLYLGQNTVLQLLYCSNNQLTSLDVRQNTVLVTLYCHNNQLPSLDVSQNTVLDNLWCKYNQLTSLDLSQNTVLDDLWCEENQLTSLDLRGMREVDNVIFYNPTLETLKVHQNIKDHLNIILLKRFRGSNVTISTHNASAGSTTYELICADYVPRAGGGSCND